MALNQGSVPQKLKEQLSLAVRNIQWSYAIFWSISATQPGVLEWGEGYYNGDIKTRKTIQAVEFNAEELGLQRSEQLRELYDSLSAGDSSPHCKRPSAALSPEDLSDTEWYYLVCMSFVFDFGQCLPGRTLATGKPFWLCNAHSADSKIFTRSLLAKSASIQTIVCFPFLGGVIELGTIEQVLEDLETIQRIKDTYLEIQQSICIKKPDTHQTSNADLPCDNNICNTDVVPVLPRLDISSPNIDVAPDDIPEDSLIFEAMNDDEEFHHSSGDCISQTFVKLGNSGLLSKEKLAAMDPVTDDLFYKSVISSLVNSQDRLVSGPCSRKHESSFVKWKNGGLLNVRKIIASESQKLLKRMLFEVPRISERFQMLNSILPTVNKVNEVSVLDNAINYLNELKKRVADLESHRIDSKELAARPRKNLLEPSEQTSDNYKSINTTPTRHKRKNRDRDETTNLTVSVTGNVVQIDVKCSWREGLLLEIVEALRSLHLDSHTVQSSTFDAVLFLNMKCKICGSMIGSAGLIRQKLEKVVRRS